ncbi:AfsR/SARP family transcriptional regulator [Streptomyces sp. 7N604]|uniref:AfsR/SARP family transcriptional regulator n=1 Tax=Streptomyces sp. 7N604 TaxID=3457415 RepID=UPI003FD10081
MRYSVLGYLEVNNQNGTPVAIQGKRSRALMAILVLHANRVVPLEQILDGIWPDNPPKSAVANVRTYVCQLRSLLDDGAGKYQLESLMGGYRLSTAPESVDFHRFGSLVEQGERQWSCGSAVAAADLLGQALSLWRGDPLPDIELGPRERAKTIALEEQRWQTYAAWVNARFVAGQRQGLSNNLLEALGERPLDESLWAALIGVLHASGRTVDALKAYSRVRKLLNRELGTEPGPLLRAVHTTALRGEPVTSLAPYPELRGAS